MSWKEILLPLLAAAVLAVVNIVSFCLMGVDKHRAMVYAAGANNWRVRRIPEATLLLWSACFGALGGVLGMYVFRHKTRHWYFRWGLPVMLAVQLTLACAPLWWQPVKTFLTALL